MMLAGDWTGQLAGERVAELHGRRSASASSALPEPDVVAAPAAWGVGGAGWRVHDEVRVRVPWWSRRPRQQPRDRLATP